MEKMFRGAERELSSLDGNGSQFVKDYLPTTLNSTIVFHPFCADQ